MTDEDSDDNDRMERADRIRRMREGRRSHGGENGATEAEPAEEPAPEADETADATEDPEAAASADASDGAEADDAGTTDETASPTVDATTDPEPTASDEGAEPADSDPSESTDAAEPRDTDSDATEPTDTDAEAASENGAATDAAAESPTDEGGFEFEQSNGDTPTDAGGDTNGADTTDEDGLEIETDVEALEEKVAALSETQRGVADSVSSGDAERAVAGLDSGSSFAIPDQATTVSEDDETIDVDGTVAAARAAAATGQRTAAARDRTRVLEFELGAERFCLDIDYIEEIVELENMTRVPNSPSYVEGVVDLRGQVTAIINPKDALDVGEGGRGDLIIVFDSESMDEQGHLGWVVDEVRQVTPVSEDEVNESPDEEQDHINGIINREDEDDFVVWTTPELALKSDS